MSNGIISLFIGFVVIIFILAITVVAFDKVRINEEASFGTSTSLYNSTTNSISLLSGASVILPGVGLFMVGAVILILMGLFFKITN